MMRRGFTVVELIITVTIMGILLTLAVVNLNTTQVGARDTERKEDVAALATNLEAFFKTGTDTSTVLGTYPSTGLTVSGETSVRSYLRDIDFKSVTAPGASSVAAGFVSATNNSQTATGVLPQPTISQYVYQPIQANGSLCTSDAQECRKFNIFYRLEADNAVYMLTSKNQ
ncbi:MAG: type II secretion system protein [Candidatus Saccharimonadota bacterium]